jgi:3D (Asp-Asp-Asp) domain-containing protein
MSQKNNQSYIKIAVILGVIFCFPLVFGLKTNASNNSFDMPDLTNKLAIAEENTLLPNNVQLENQKMNVIITAYSSTVWQCDDTPFITASNTHVRDGVIANNLLPFNTKIRIPELYGDKIFVVEDRMHYLKSPYQVDLWFPSYEEAADFGVKRTYIEILDNI